MNRGDFHIQADRKIIKQLMRGIAIVGIVVICVGTTNMVSSRIAAKTYAQREQNNQILNQTQELRNAMLSIESGIRGFIITGQKSYLTTIEQSILAFNQTRAAMEKITNDDHIQQRRLDLIHANYVALVYDLETPLIEYRSTVGEGGYSQELMQLFIEVSTKGRYLTNEILRLIKEIKQKEDQLLAELDVHLKLVERIAFYINILGPLGILALLVFIARISIVKIKKYQEERSSYESDLQKNRDRLASVIEGTHAGTWEWDITTGHLMVNERWAGILGYSQAELEPVSIHTLDDRTNPEDQQISIIRREQVLAGDMEFYDMDIRMRHRDGHWMWIHDRGKVVQRSNTGVPLVMAGTRTDLTSRKQIQEQLDIERERLRATLLAVADGVIATDASGLVLMMNRIAEQLTGWEQTEAIGRSFSEIFHTVHGPEQQRCNDLIKLMLEKGTSVVIEDDSLLLSRDGSSWYVEGTVSPVFNGNGQVDGTVSVFSDITEKKVRQDEYVRLSYRDPLTGLHNRRYYDQKREEMDREDFYPLAIVSADVDGLKLTNDAFGHETGDRLLQLVGESLKNVCREDDVIARVGGDEFIMLLPRTDLEQVAQMVERLSISLKGMRNLEIAISVSFGFAIKSDALVGYDEVAKQAEDNMYQQKLVESPKMKKRIVDLLLAVQFQKDAWEYEHCMAVSAYAEKFARLMGFSDEDVAEMKTAGLYHDIGKIAINSKILCRPTVLDEREWDVVRRHSELGCSMLRSVNEYAPFAQYVLHHHERWDGQGYPNGLAGEAIPFRARMLTVIDAYVAMVSDRPYRQAQSIEFAVEQLRTCAGSQFDPKLARIFVEQVLNRAWL